MPLYFEIIPNGYCTPKFIVAGVFLYLNLTHKKKTCLSLSSQDLVKVKLLTPNSRHDSKNRKVAVGRRKKIKVKRKQKKKAPAGDKLCLGSWARRHFISALALSSRKCSDSQQPHTEQREIFDWGTGATAEYCNKLTNRNPAMTAKAFHCSICFPQLHMHWFPQYAVLLVTFYQT